MKLRTISGGQGKDELILAIITLHYVLSLDRTYFTFQVSKNLIFDAIQLHYQNKVQISWGEKGGTVAQMTAR